MTRVAVFGCKTTTQFLIENLPDPLAPCLLVTISPEMGELNQVADYVDLRPFAKERNLETYQAISYGLLEAVDQERIRSENLDIAFVVGWQRLLPSAVLDALSVGAFGMHGSSMHLPLGRGRSPLNWSIIEGRSSFYTSLFRYDVGVDSGDVLDTALFSINVHDTAESLHFKNVVAMKELIKRNTGQFCSGHLELDPQPDNTPTYYPKRDPSDSLIDWSLDLRQVHRHIRAVTRPFNGAYTYAEGERIIIWRASPFETDLGFLGSGGAAPGEITEVFPGGKFLVRCLGGTLLVHEFDARSRMRKGVILSDGGEQRRIFPRNDQGYFDLPK